MRSRLSLSTGNTLYYADNMLFSSMNRQNVENFELFGHTSKLDLDRPSAIALVMAGHCPMAEQWLFDHTQVHITVQECEKELKKGNYCPMRVSSQLDTLRNELLAKITDNPESYQIPFD